MNGEIINATPLEPIQKDPFWLRAIKSVAPIAIAICIALLIRTFIMEPIAISGASMESTYHDGQYVLLEKVSYYFRSPKRGEVVVCHYPDEYYTSTGRSENSWCVKRVIGLAGDEISVVNGEVYLNGEKIEESYLDEGMITDGIHGTITVPEGCVFVMGDNRIVSSDSRAYNVGPIPLSQIKGRLMW